MCLTCSLEFAYYLHLTTSPPGRRCLDASRIAMAAEVLKAVVDAMQAQAQVRDLHVQVHGCTVLRNVSCASAMTQRRRPSSCRLANAGGVEAFT